MKQMKNLALILVIMALIAGGIGVTTAGAGVEIGTLTATTEKSVYTLSDIRASGGDVKITVEVRDISGNVLTPENGTSVKYQLDYNQPSETNIVNAMAFERSSGKFIAWALLPFPVPTDALVGKYFITINASSGSDIVNKTITFEVVNDNPPPASNIILNPGFESGTASWVFFTNGKGSFGAIPPAYTGSKSANVSIGTVGSNMQLYQRAITLEPNTKYRLSFVAYSSTGHDMIIRLFKHVSPYNAYMPDFKADLLANKWNTFSTEFTTPGFSGTVNDARLMFYFTGNGKAGDTYRIDDIRLEKVLPDLKVSVNPQIIGTRDFDEEGLTVGAFDIQNIGNVPTGVVSVTISCVSNCQGVDSNYGWYANSGSSNFLSKVFESYGVKYLLILGTDTIRINEGANEHMIVQKTQLRVDSITLTDGKNFVTQQVNMLLPRDFE